jgi:glucosamine--fructose-6-phosphate aminotransferase (isomerizing)
MIPPLVENILAQSNSLESVMAHQYGAGREALLAAAGLLRSSHRIVMSGMGASLHACIPLANFLVDQGTAVSVIETAELLHFQTNILKAGTAVVLVSRSGESIEVTRLLPILQERSCNVIAVVNAPASTLALQATHTIVVNSLPDELVAIQSYTGSVAALLLLGAAVGGDFEGDAKAELERTILQLSRWVPECFRFSGGWPGFFGNNVPMYLLGRGPTLASVRTGALLLHEVAKMPAVAMSVPQFRHGPVEAVNERFHTIVFGTQKNSASLDSALAEQLTRMGAKVRWIGPATESSGIAPLCEWPEDLPERFIPVAEVIPLQIAAYQTALWHGIVPGHFRYATAVTLSEQDFAIEAAVEGEGIPL